LAFFGIGFVIHYDIYFAIYYRDCCFFLFGSNFETLPALKPDTLLFLMVMPPTEPHSRALRFLMPSVRDLIFIFLFWSLLSGPLSNRPLADPDIGWHIRTGELILQTHSVPRTDPFSSTMQGQPWFAWEWLYDLLLGILNHACGLNGVVWLCAALVATTFMILLSQLLRRGTGLLLAILLMLLAEAAAAIHLYARPHIVSWLFSLLWFVALEHWELSDQRNVPRWPWLRWFFPASMLLWVNLHGGWLFGIALLAIYIVAAFVESLRTKDAFAAIRAAHRARAMAVAWLISAFATLVNPFGWRLHVHIFHYLSDRYLMDHIDEFRSPDFHGWAQRCFVALLLLVLVSFVAAAPSARRKLRLSNLLVLLFAIYAGFYSARNLPISSMLLALITGPILWESFVSLANSPVAWRWLRNVASRISNFSDRMSAQEMQLTGHLWPLAAVAFALAICLQGGWLGSRQLIHAAFDPEKVPAAAVDFLQHEPESQAQQTPPVFSTDAWGGYLIYRMYPGRKVVLDDRHDLYGSDRIRRYLLLMRGEPGWQNVLQGEQIRIALLPAGSTLANLLRLVPQDWQIIYEDKVAVVFQKKS
jgi:hypothetical protein